MATFHQTYQLLIPATQSQSFVDIPTRDAKSMQLVSVSAATTNAMTNAVLSGITTIVQSNGFIVKPTDSGKPDVAIMPGATLRIVGSRTQPSAVPVRVMVTVEATELP